MGHGKFPVPAASPDLFPCSTKNSAVRLRREIWRKAAGIMRSFLEPWAKKRLKMRNPLFFSLFPGNSANRSSGLSA
jgi:hypothetical protein